MLILSLFFADALMGQTVPEAGGRYQPPRDYVPPNFGGGSGSPPGGGGPEQDPPEFGTPAPPAAGRSPMGPSGPGAGGSGRRPGGSGGGMARKKSRGGSGLDRWEMWWEFNKDAFLSLKNRLGEFSPRSGTSGFLVGRGKKDRVVSSQKTTEEVAQKEILPALKAAIGDDDLEVCCAAVTAVARIVSPDGEDPVIGHFTPLLARKHLKLRRLAGLSYGIVRDPGGVAICENLLGDTKEGRRLTGTPKIDKLTRSFAALALGLIGDYKAEPLLRRTIEKNLTASEKDLAACAIVALGLLGNREQGNETERFLVELLENQRIDPFLRAYIPIALSKRGSRAVMPALSQRFRDSRESLWITQSCAIALGSIATVEDKDDVSVLINYVKKGKDLQTRQFAVIGLAQIGARNPDFASHKEIHKEIHDLFLSELSKRGNAQHRSWASLAAAIHARKHDALWKNTVVAVRDAFLEANDPSEKSAHAVSLGLLEAADEGELLFKELIESKDQVLRGYLCIGLGLMRWRSAIDEMRGYLDDPSLYSLRIQAATALGLMGDRKMIPTLIKPLVENERLYVMASASQALGLIGDESAIVPLREVLADRKSPSLARKFSATALGMLGEKTDLPWVSAIAANFNYCLKIDVFVELFSIP